MTQKTTITVVALLLLAGGAAIAVKNPGMFFKNSGAEPRAETASFPTGDNSRSGGRIADREREKQKKESIQLAAQKRYEELLEKNPDMRPAYRNVPDEENGYLQFLLLAEKVGGRQLPDDLKLMLEGQSDWDPHLYEKWLAENQGYFASILNMAELTDESTKGIELNRMMKGTSRLISEFALVLRSSARLALEQGDHDSALRYFKASAGLGDRLIDVEVPCLLSGVQATAIRNAARDSFREHFLPALGSDPEVLKAWSAAVFRDENPAEDYARVIKGEWNVSVRHFMLPQFLGEIAPGTPNFAKGDADVFIDSYTSEMRKFAEGVFHQGPDRFDVSQINAWNPESVSHLRNADLLGETLTSFQQITQRLANQHTLQAMHATALAIQLGGKPRLDPVSGKEFQWDPQNRVLSAPEGVRGIDEIKIP